MAAGAILSLGTWSCAQDNIDPEPEQKPSGTQTTVRIANYYLEFKFLINDAGMGTRANTYEDKDADTAKDEDYVYGNNMENEIGDNGNFIIFFDNKQVLQMYYPIYTYYEVNPSPEDDDGKKIEKRYWTLIQDIAEEDLPSYAMVVLNGTPIYDKLISECVAGSSSIDKVLSQVWSSDDTKLLGRDSEGHFVMTNSAYIKDGNVQVAVPITPEMFHELEHVGDPIPDPNLTDDEILTIHVERMLAKVSFRIDNVDSKDFIYNKDRSVTFPPKQAIICETIDDKGNANNVRGHWRATVTGWNMNAFETQERLFKNIDTTTPYSGWTWYDENYYRSFWAIDENYESGYYPDQYREPVDVDMDNFRKDKRGNPANPSLKYFSFNQLKQNSALDHITYIPENTYNAAALNKGENVDLTAGTHLIICARLDLKIEGENDDKWIIGGETQDFYRGEFGIFYTDWRKCFWGIVRRFNNTLASQTKMRYYLYDWDGKEDKEVRIPYEALTTSEPGSGNYRKNFKLCYDGEEITWDMVTKWGDDMKAKVFVPATIKTGDGRILPWIDGMEIVDLGNPDVPYENKPRLQIYTKILQNQEEIEEGKPIDITPSHPLYGDLEAQNKAYHVRDCTDNDIKSLLLEYLGPIDHYSWGSMYYAAPLKINITNNVMGSVRNAWYRYALEDITSIGTSIDDLDQPIIPDYQSTHDQTNLIFEVIDWHEFEFTAPLL